MDSLIPLDYASLRVIWWFLLGLLIISFAIMDGFDLGIAVLLPFLTQKDNERRIMINVIGPFWEGNQVWLITAAGAVFAAWPFLYATLFSAFYSEIIILLLALIIRPVGIKYRSKIESIVWRSAWDGAIFFSGVSASFIFGLIFGNIITGIPFNFDKETLYPICEGYFVSSLQPFPLFTGLISLFVFTLHGAALLAWRTEDSIAEKCFGYGKKLSIITLCLFLIFGFWISKIDGYTIVSTIGFNNPSNPCMKTVEIQAGAWLNNYKNHAEFWIVPISCIIATLSVFFSFLKRLYGLAFLSSSLSIVSAISAIGIAIFPFLLPSSLNGGEHSLILWDSSSSHLTLWIMLLATILFLPIVIIYTSWVYRVMRGNVSIDSLRENPNSY